MKSQISLLRLLEPPKRWWETVEIMETNRRIEKGKWDHIFSPVMLLPHSFEPLMYEYVFLTLFRWGFKSAELFLPNSEIVANQLKADMELKLAFTLFIWQYSAYSFVNNSLTVIPYSDIYQSLIKCHAIQGTLWLKFHYFIQKYIGSSKFN